MKIGDQESYEYQFSSIEIKFLLRLINRFLSIFIDPYFSSFISVVAKIIDRRFALFTVTQKEFNGN